MKFREQYGWFSLSDYLQAQADDFKEYISNGVFLNNIPTGSANENEKPECKTEAKLAVKDALRQALGNQFDVGDGTLSRWKSFSTDTQPVYPPAEKNSE